MSQENNLPNIKPEVNREEKKKSGLAALLLRFGIGSEAGTGAAGTGALGNLLSAGVSGGILATKAGIIGLKCRNGDDLITPVHGNRHLRILILIQKCPAVQFIKAKQIHRVKGI